MARTARSAGVKSLKLAGTLDIDTCKIGQIDGLTLADALRSLHQAAGTPVALIIDEAQHALTSEADEVAMTALKLARDQMNQPGQVNLMLVMSGSDRDKLLRLVVSAGAPFYASQIQALPPLDTAFIAHVAHLVEAQRPDLVPVDRAALQEAFVAFGNRPQFSARHPSPPTHLRVGLSRDFQEPRSSRALQRPFENPMPACWRGSGGVLADSADVPTTPADVTELLRSEQGSHSKRIYAPAPAFVAPRPRHAVQPVCGSWTKAGAWCQGLRPEGTA